MQTGFNVLACEKEGRSKKEEARSKRGRGSRGEYSKCLAPLIIEAWVGYSVSRLFCIHYLMGMKSVTSRWKRKHRGTETPTTSHQNLECDRCDVQEQSRLLRCTCRWKLIIDIVFSLGRLEEAKRKASTPFIHPSIRSSIRPHIPCGLQAMSSS
ncbi:hypothetical protein BDV97DRAFT_191118 [Delphinella strobiligena]|nr:hypothetical protein BDV97DRAFT_191118 [Delphinella strobiligena]